MASNDDRIKYEEERIKKIKDADAAIMEEYKKLKGELQLDKAKGIQQAQQDLRIPEVEELRQELQKVWPEIERWMKENVGMSKGAEAYKEMTTINVDLYAGLKLFVDYNIKRRKLHHALEPVKLVLKNDELRVDYEITFEPNGVFRPKLTYTDAGKAHTVSDKSVPDDLQKSFGEMVLAWAEKEHHCTFDETTHQLKDSTGANVTTEAFHRLCEQSQLQGPEHSLDGFIAQCSELQSAPVMGR